MQDLTLVGVHDDGEHLVLAAPDGTRFRLLADDALRLAARRTARVPGEAEGVAAPLTPRQVQARLRAGEDAAEIAAATGESEERVRRYEAPVLAERAHVASRARDLPVRWRDGSGRSPALEDLVAERLAARGVDGAPGWDAWRREDGAWLVQAVFRAGARERRATWALDLQRSSLEALDDESRWLSSVDAGSGPGSEPPGAGPGPRLAPVREEVYDVDDAGATRRPRPDDEARAPVDLASRRAGGASRRSPEGAGTAGRDVGADGEKDRKSDGDEQEPSDEVAEQDRRERVSRTLDLLEHLRGRRGRRQPLADPEDEEVEALTWAELEALTARVDATSGEEGPPEEIAGAPGREDPWDAAGEPPAAHPPASHPEEAVDDEVLGGSTEGRTGEGDADGELPAAAPPEDGADAPAEAPRTRRRRRRTAAGRDDDGVPGQEELLPEPSRADTAPEDDRDDRRDVEEGGTADGDDARAGDRGRRPAQRKDPSTRRGARPGVPSWDDIVFGQRRD